MARGTIFIPAYNCEKYITDTISTLARQKSREFDVLFVDDASTDGTLGIAKKLLQEFFPNRHRLIANQVNIGKAANAYIHLRDIDSDYVAIIDGDDCLVDDEIISVFSAEYDNNFDVVYSNYITSDGKKGHCSALSSVVCPRKQGWRTSHLFSFRTNLFRNVPSEYFKDEDGRWFRSACDFAIAYPILDQTRRYRFVDRYAYRYTVDRPDSHHNLNGETSGLSSPQQRANAAKILGYPTLPCRNALEGSGAPYEAFVVSRLDQIEKRWSAYHAPQREMERELSRLSLAQLAVRENIPISWLRQTGGWAMEHEAYSYIAERLAGIESPSILEFGSGSGSKLLHQLARNRGGRCVSVEHDKEWHQRTSSELHKNNLYVEGSVIAAKLIDVNVFGVDTKFYDMSWLAAAEKFDLVLVDGPPAALATFGRLAALPSVAKNLSPYFSVILDDYNREPEQQIVEFWRTVAAELSYEEIKFTGKKICVVSPV